MSGLGGLVRSAGKWTVWARLLLLAEVAIAIKRHLDLLDGREKIELQRLVRKSKGKPSNLTAGERERLRRLVAKLEPGELVREAASVFPFGRRSR